MMFAHPTQMADAAVAAGAVEARVADARVRPRIDGWVLVTEDEAPKDDTAATPAPGEQGPGSSTAPPPIDQLPGSGTPPGEPSPGEPSPASAGDTSGDTSGAAGSSATGAQGASGTEGTGGGTAAPGGTTGSPRRTMPGSSGAVPR
jgi:hypothetical protein